MIAAVQTVTKGKIMIAVMSSFNILLNIINWNWQIYAYAQGTAVENIRENFVQKFVFRPFHILFFVSP